MVEDSALQDREQPGETGEPREASKSLRVGSSPIAGRRSFLALVGVAVGSGAVGSVVANDDEDEAEPNGEDETNGGETEGPPGTDALFGYIEARYGDRLDGGRHEEVTEQIAGSLESAAAISEVDLENGDEPAFRFSAYRGDES